jgi:hypothetical protein
MIETAFYEFFRRVVSSSIIQSLLQKQHLPSKNESISKIVINDNDGLIVMPQRYPCHSEENGGGWEGFMSKEIDSP